MKFCSKCGTKLVKKQARQAWTSAVACLKCKIVYETFEPDTMGTGHVQPIVDKVPLADFERKKT